MASSNNNSSSNKFTVRQICMFMELKRAGLNAADVIEGFNEIDEYELASPRQQQQTHGNSQQQHQQTLGSNQRNNHNLRGSNKQQRSSPTPPPVLNNNNNSSSNAVVQHTSKRRRMSPPNLNPGSGVNPYYQRHNSTAESTSSTNSNSSGYPLSLLSVSSSSVTSTNLKNYDRSPTFSAEVYELIKRDVTEVRWEIDAFMTRHQIKRVEISKATNNRLTRSYVSFWFNTPTIGHSNNVHILFQWYLDEQQRQGDIVTPKAGPPGSNTVPGDASRMPAQDANLWLHVCASYLADLTSFSDLDAICRKCTELLQEHYLGCGILSEQRVTRDQLIAYVNRRPATQVLSPQGSARNVPDSKKIPEICYVTGGGSDATAAASAAAAEVEELMTRDQVSLRNMIDAYMTGSNVTRKAVVSLDITGVLHQWWVDMWFEDPVAYGTEQHAASLKTLLKWYVGVKQQHAAVAVASPASSSL